MKHEKQGKKEFKAKEEREKTIGRTISEPQLSEDNILLETESFRMWDGGKVDRENLDDGIPIEYKGLKLTLTGFNKVVETKTNKLIFAYKFNHEEKNYKFYVARDISEEDKRKLEVVFSLLSPIRKLGYAFIDMNEALERLYSQKHLLDKVAKLKEKKP